MSLQLWMPLMGDLRNQGLGDYSISTLGTLSWVTGKLGSQAMRAGNGTQVVNGIRIEDTFTDLLNENYSVSVWVKPYGQHVHYNGSIFSSGDWNKANKRWAFGVSQDNSKVDVLCMNYNTYITCSVPENEWTHLVCARGDDDIVKLYKNGQYIGERNCSSDAAFDSDATFSCIGRESYANGYFSFNGAIQDFRLYNHCLSQMEVKQLSQGLILHYPLNRQGWGQDNLIINSNDFTKWTKESVGKVTLESDGFYHITSTTTNGTRYGIYYDFTFPDVGTYTLSALVKTEWHIGFSAASSFVWTSQTIGGTGDEQIVSKTVTTTSENNKCRIYLWGTNDTSGNVVTSNYIKWMKIEKGSIATPWCPNPTDALYSTLGLNSIIEYDCSGFCNNGTKTGTFSWTSDTPKYSVSTTAAGGASTYLEGPILPAEAQTAALWIKSKKSQNAAIFNDKTSGLQIGLLNSLLYMNSKASTTGFTTTHWIDDEWNHVVVTYDGTTRKAYINGQPETQSGASNYYIHNADNCWLWNRSYNNNYPFNGSLSDFRIYATALSPSDVKSLYQNCATIDPDGTIRGQIRS